MSKIAQMHDAYAVNGQDGDKILPAIPSLPRIVEYGELLQAQGGTAAAQSYAPLPL